MKKYNPGYVHSTICGEVILLERLPYTNKCKAKCKAKWKCFCGKEWICAINDIINGNTASCGCWRQKLIEDSVLNLNESYLTKLYESIKNRIYNNKNKDYNNYGGRGITMDPAWVNNKSKFIQDILLNIGERPNNYQLDRINTNHGYYLNNLRWVTPKENCNNKRNNKLITINNQTKTITQWAEISGIKRKTISNRISSNWPECRLLDPVKTQKYKTDLTDFVSIYNGIMYRCYNPKCKAFNNYGGRGITIYETWKGNYKEFQKDILKFIGEKPAPEYQLDRIDNNGNYEPKNIRWVTSKENNNNKSSNTLIEINGQIKTCAQWAEENKISLNLILNRYHHLKWKGEDLLKPATSTKFNKEEVNNIKNLAIQGFSNYKIAKLMNCGRKTIINILRDREAYSK